MRENLLERKLLCFKNYSSVGICYRGRLAGGRGEGDSHVKGVTMLVANLIVDQRYHYSQINGLCHRFISSFLLSPFLLLSRYFFIQFTHNPKEKIPVWVHWLSA